MVAGIVVISIGVLVLNTLLAVGPGRILFNEILKYWENWIAIILLIPPFAIVITIPALIVLIFYAFFDIVIDKLKQQFENYFFKP